MVWKSKVILIGLIVVLAIPALAQNRYVVFFKDKIDSPYSVSNPSAFLSQRAINRRIQQGISVTENDVPVNESYVTLVQNTGADVYFRTRWLNALLIQCDPSLV